MSAFEFAFTLFGLVLGLAMAEVLGGFVRVLKARSVAPGKRTAIRIGWFTPTLAFIIVMDLVTSWNLAWQALDDVPVNVFTLAVGLLFTGLYYVAATLVWPEDPETWPDLDRWFDRHKAQAGGAIALANIGFSLTYLLAGLRDHVPVVQWLYIGSAVALMVTRKPWQSAIPLAYLAGLLCLIVLDAAFQMNGLGYILTP